MAARPPKDKALALSCQLRCRLRRSATTQHCASGLQLRQCIPAQPKPEPCTAPERRPQQKSKGHCTILRGYRRRCPTARHAPIRQLHCRCRRRRRRQQQQSRPRHQQDRSRALTAHRQAERRIESELEQTAARWMAAPSSPHYSQSGADQCLSRGQPFC